MYDINDLIPLLTPLGYTVELAQQREPNLTDLEDLPVLYLGYRAIDSTATKGYNNYQQGGEDLTQIFEVHICCEATHLPTIWRRVHKALLGKSTQTAEEQFTSITYEKGGVIGIENGRLWWLDRWMVQFPSFNTFTTPGEI